MLSVSKKTDYALLALTYLARIEPGRAANTREIAEQHDIPVELLAKILQRLAKAQLILSTAGPTGGYRLARPAAQISVGTIIDVVDGSPALMPCMKTVENTCGQQAKCTVRKPLARINARILQMLQMVSLAEICADEQEEESTVFPIVAQMGPLPRRSVALAGLVPPAAADTTKH